MIAFASLVFDVEGVLSQQTCKSYLMLRKEQEPYMPRDTKTLTSRNICPRSFAPESNICPHSVKNSSGSLSKSTRSKKLSSASV